jgi:hypothetical protein
VQDLERLHPALQLLPPTKAREADSALRSLIVDTLLLLCTARAGREAVRAAGAYEVVRAAHLAERDERVKEQIDRLVVLLKGQEPEGATVEEVEDDEEAVIEV